MPIRSEVHDQRLTLTLDQPPLNVLDRASLDALDRALREIPPESRLVILQGAGDRAFSAGVAVEDHVRDKVPAMLKAVHGVARRLRALPMPTLAVVHGHCLGGGFELALCCDLIIASDDARFAFPEVKVGCFPPIAAALLPHRLGRGRALELILSGRTLTATEALALGLVHEVVSRTESATATQAWMERLTTHSAAVARPLKAAVVAGERLEFEEALEETERIYLKELLPLKDMEEGLNAFLEKRTPVWKHR